jgi:hypothetical protein
MLDELVFFLHLIVFFFWYQQFITCTIVNNLKWTWIFDTFDGPWPSYQYIISGITYLPINIYNRILKRLVAKLNSLELNHDGVKRMEFWECFGFMWLQTPFNIK